MLQEFKDLSQNQDGFRKLFFDNYFDLFIWYDTENGNIIGFQLCYNKEEEEHSLIWRVHKGFLHSGIETGENRPGRAKQSPVLIKDGVFNNLCLAKKFEHHSDQLEKEIFDLVYTKILEYEE